MPGARESVVQPAASSAAQRAANAEVFAREADNFFEEALEQAHGAARLLRDALQVDPPSGKDTQSLESALSLWRIQLHRRLCVALTVEHAGVLGMPTGGYLWARRVRLAIWALGGADGSRPSLQSLELSDEPMLGTAEALCGGADGAAQVLNAGV